MRSGEWAAGSVREVHPLATGLPGLASSSVSVARELPVTLPGQARAVGGLSAATADMTVRLAGDATTRVGTPWSRRDWPRSGDPVSLTVTDGANAHGIFRGRVDGTSSSLRGQEFSVGLVDDTDNLSAQVSEQALFREMPPRATDGTQRARMTGLLNTHLPVLAARAAGYHNVPPVQDHCLLSAPLVGSSWPERGELDQSYRSSNVGGWGRFHPGALVDQGLGTVHLSDFYGIYLPGSAPAWAGGITAERPLTLTFGAKQTQATSSYMECQWSWGEEIRSIRLAVTSNRSVIAQFVKNGGTPEGIVTLPSGDLGPWEYVSLRVRRMSTTVLEWQLTTDTGVVKTARTLSTTTGTVMMDTLWHRVHVRIPEGCGLNGLQVNYSDGPTPAELFQRSFIYRPDVPLRSMAVIPALVAEPARDLLHAQAEAESAAVWLDEDGVLRWLGRTRMLRQPVTRTLTSAEIADATVTMDAQDVRKRVSVKYVEWAARVSRRSTITLYEGSQDEWVDDDAPEAIIAPPDGEQWVQVDSTLRQVYAGEGSRDFNTGQGSFHGWTALTKDGDEIADPSGGRVWWAFARIGPSTWKWVLDIRWLPAKADRIKTATRSDPESWLKPTYRGRGLPLVRGMGAATSSEEVASSAARGPSWAPELELDVGWHVQSASDAKAIADWVAAELVEQRPRLSDIKVLPDPRIQLGDKIQLSEPVRTGLSVIGIVTAISQSLGAGKHEMTIGLMVVSAHLDGVTFNDFTDWYSGMPLSAVDAKFKGESFAQHDSNPLRD